MVNFFKKNKAFTDFDEGAPWFIYVVLMPMIFSFGIYPFLIGMIPFQAYDLARLCYIFSVSFLVCRLIFNALPRFDLFFVAAFFVGFFSVLRNGSQSFSLVELFNNLFLLCLIPLMVGVFKRDLQRIRFVTIASIIFLVPLLLFLIDFYSDLRLDFWNVYLNNKRVFDDAILPIIFLSVRYLYFSKFRMAGFFISVSMLFLLLIDNHRAGVLSFFVSLMFSYFYFKSAFVCLFRVFCCSVSLYFLFLFFAQPSFDEVIRTSSSYRYELYFFSLHELLRDPIFGVGLNDFRVGPASHPHNIFLQYIVEWGLVAGGLLVVALFGWVIWVFNRIDFIDEYVFLAFLAALVNISIGGAMIYPASQLIYVSVFSMAISDSGLRASVFLFDASRFRFLIRVIACFFVFIFVFFVLSGSSGCSNCQTGPRFWFYGDLYNNARFGIF